MKIKRSILLFSQALVTASVVVLASCGGGGGDGAVLPDGIIGGTGIKGPVAAATVNAYAIASGVMGAKIGTATTDADGNFRMSIGNYSGPVMLQMAGGTYTDEATGIPMPLTSGNVMTAMLPTVSANTMVNGVKMTPLTSMAQAMAQHLSGGMSDANINAANAAVGNYFMVSDILHTSPMNPLVAGSGSGATQDSVNYGMAMAAISQLAKTQGMSTSSAMVTAMMNDASDGKMDGMMSSSAVIMGGMGMGGATMPTTAATSGLAGAMSDFASSAMNKSGVTASTMQTLMNKLSASNGQLTSSTPTSSTMRLVSGTVFNGTVKQAAMAAYAVTSGTMGAQLASAMTDTQGNFTMSLGTYSGPVMLQASGATFTDPATGTSMTMGSSDVMTAVMTSLSSGQNITGMMVTPLTSMAQMRAQSMGGGMTDANIAAANTAVGNFYMVSDILKTMPMNTALTGSVTAATQDQKDYGALIAAMSQYAKSLGMSVSSTMVTDMMNDAADGIMNGKMGTTQISMGMGSTGGMMNGGQTQMMSSTAGTTDLANAMSAFMSSSTNQSGATAVDVSALMQKLISSNGQLQ